MHRRLHRITIFILCIIFPLSALTEPSNWLDPLIRMNSQDQMRTGTITFSISPEGQLPVLEREYNSIFSSHKYLDTTDEEVAAYYDTMTAWIQRELISARNTLSAMNALFNELSIRYVIASNSTQFTLILRQEPVMTFALTETDEGKQLLTSDLFPSYALEMSPAAFDRMSGTYYYVSDDTDAFPDTAADQLLQLLPQLSQVDFTQLLIQASRAELETLAAQGHAENLNGVITYTGTEEEKKQLLSQAEVTYDPIYLQLKALAEQFENDSPTAPESDDLFQLFEEEEDDLLDEPYVHTHSISGDTVTKRNARILDYVEYRDYADFATGFITRESHESTWENYYQLTVSPSVIDYSACTAVDDLQTLSLNASEPDKIKINYTQENPSYSQSMAMVLSRDENGQSLDWEIAAHEPPEIYIRASWANDILSDIQFNIESRVSDERLPILTFAMKQDDTVIPTLLSPDSLTVITSDRYGKFTDIGYQKELQAAKSALSILVMTKLPREAYPLSTPLLAAISQMGQ